jgi:FkbM family methyltransferase
MPVQPLRDTRDRANYTPEQCRAVPWFNIDGDNTLRVNYNLTPNSVVYDVGGYVGDWAADIYQRYGCNIEIFEPVNDFASKIKRKFVSKPKVHTHTFGLAGKTHKASITREGASSSTHKSSKRKETVELVRAGDFIKTRHKKIDLIKINIEGGEYELLEDLIKSGAIKRITNLQVQFHNFVPNAQERRHRLHKKLSETHYLTYSYPWIWENWRLKK